MTGAFVEAAEVVDGAAEVVDGAAEVVEGVDAGVDGDVGAGVEVAGGSVEDEAKTKPQFKLLTCSAFIHL